MLLLALIGLMLSGGCTSAQNGPILGFWNGRLAVPGASLRIEVVISEDGGALKGIFRSPDQSNRELALDSVMFSDAAFIFELGSLFLRYEGTLTATGDRIDGFFIQHGAHYPLSLVREQLEAQRPERPQTPQPPFPYRDEEVQFASGDPRYRLSGTLTHPEREAIAGVVLVAGSGRQDRNSEIDFHQPFAVWADFLARHGVAVLRYDERGVALSEGIHEHCTTFDLSDDALAARMFLNEQLGGRVPSGIMGHSEGGLISAIAASKDPTIDFIISLAGPGLHSLQILYDQTVDIAVASGLTQADAESQADSNRQLFEVAIQATDSADAAHRLQAALAEKVARNEGIDVPFEVINQQINNPWMRTFLGINPADYWSKVNCHVLALNGDKDLQVSGATNLRAIAFALRRNKNNRFMTKLLNGHNHLFQRTNTGRISEYGELTETVSEETLNAVAQWLNNLYQP